MSYVDPKTSMPQFKKFITEEELEEKRQQRQEEWEKVRKAEDPVEAPEEEYDSRSLYHRLQEQKQKKQDEFDEQHKMKNQVKGLESDEAEFLDFVSKRQEEIEKARYQEDEVVLNELRDTVTTVRTRAAEKRSSKPPSAGSKNSQKTLLAGVVKRKSYENNGLTDSKKAKSEDFSEKYESESTEKDLGTVSDELTSRSGRQVIAILPGIGEYTDSSADDTDSSLSDSEGEIEAGLALLPPKEMIIEHGGQQYIVKRKF